MLTGPVRRQDLRKAYEEVRGQGQIGFVTFHQNYAYEDFVEGLRPIASASRLWRNQVSYAAWQKPRRPPRTYMSVIDEINRANISSVFGETITLSRKHAASEIVPVFELEENQAPSVSEYEATKKRAFVQHQ